MNCSICGDVAQFECPCGQRLYCDNVECSDEHLEMCGDAFVGAGPESETGSTTEGPTPARVTGTLAVAQEILDPNPRKTFKTLKTRMLSVYPPQNYPYKVLHYDRCNLRPLRLTRDSALSITKDSSPQRFNRDFRGPWTPLRGGILSFPTGSGKTRLMHAILGNYNRVLVEQIDPKTGMPVQRFKQLIYVTKTELVVDARKDFAAQKDRSQNILTTLLDRHGISHSAENEFAPFNPAENIMSYRTFSNMLEGENAAGRRFWAGLQITDKTNVQPNAQIQGVPTAYHKMSTGEWQRGNLPHNWAELQQGRPAVSFRVQRKTGSLPSLESETYRNAFTQRLLGDWAKFRRGQAKGTDIYTLSDVQVLAQPRGQRVADIKIQTLWAESSIPPQKLWDRFISEYGNEAIRDVITRRLSRSPGISISSLTISRDLPPESEASDKRSWKIVQETTGRKVTYSWAPVANPDASDRLLVEAAAAFNPLDSLVVVFDEGDLLFNREKLLAGERAKTDLIVKALRDSEATAFFGSGTIDLFPRLSMLSALTPSQPQANPTRFPYEPFDIPDLSGAVKLNYAEVRELLNQYLSGKGDLSLDPKFLTRFKGLTSHSTVEGMRDFFPEFLYDPYGKPGAYTHFIPLPLEHAQSVTELLPDVSASTLMQRISYAGTHEDRLNIAGPFFDPDYAYEYLVRQRRMPILDELLRDMRKHDEEEFADWNMSTLPLSRRAIMSSLADDADGIAKVAAAMVAVGYRWLPLVPNTDPVNKEKRRAMRKKGEKLPDRLRTMRFGEPVSNPAQNVDPAHAPFTSDGGPPPAMVILSEELFAAQTKKAVEINTYEALASYVRERSFKTPYKFKGASKLRAAGIELELRQLIAKKAVYYFDASQESMDIVDRAYPQNSFHYNFFQGLDKPTLFVKKRTFDQYEGMYRLLPAALELEPPPFEQLRELVEVSATLSSVEREDAKEMIIDFSNSLECFNDNVRFSLVGRKIGGQGIDIFRATVGYNIDVAPDYRAQVQRRGRLGRRCGHRDLEFERHFVKLHTYVATWPAGYPAPKYEEIRASADEEDDEETDYHLPGEKEAVRAIEVDPLTINTRSVYGAADELLPYEVVRILGEEPALTRLRLWGEKEFDAMAIDEEYNRIQINSEEKPVYSNTNYVLNVGRVIETFREAVASERANFDEAGTRLEAALAELEEQQKAELQQLVANNALSEIVSLGDRYAKLREDLKERFDPAVLEARVLKAQSALDVFETIAQAQTEVPLWRHATEEKQERQLMVLGEAKVTLNPAYFALGENFDVLNFLKYLVDHQFAIWNPQILDPNAPLKRKPPAKGSKEKRPTLSHSLQHLFSEFLIGAEDDDDVEPFVSFGNVIETTNFADEEQESIEIAAAERFKSMAQNIGIWSETVTKTNPTVDLWVSSDEEATVAYVYSIIGGGSVSPRNATALKKAILELYTRGVMNWNRGLLLFAHVLSALQDRVPKGDQEALVKFMDSLGRFCALLYSHALHQPKSVATLIALNDTYGIDFGKNPAELEQLANNLQWWGENRREPFEQFVRMLQSDYFIDVANSWSALQKALQDRALRNNFELATLFKRLSNVTLVEASQTQGASAAEYLKQLSRGASTPEALQRASPELAAKSALVDALTENYPVDSLVELYPKSTFEIVEYLALDAQQQWNAPLEKLVAEARQARPGQDRAYYLNLLATEWDAIKTKPSRSKLTKALKSTKIPIIQTGFRGTVDGTKQKLYYREDNPGRILYEQKKEEFEFPYEISAQSYIDDRIEFVGDVKQLGPQFRDAVVARLASEDTALAGLLVDSDNRAILTARLAEVVKDRPYGSIATYATPRVEIREYIDFLSKLNVENRKLLERVGTEMQNLDASFDVRSLLFQENNDPPFEFDFKAERPKLYESALGWLLRQETEEPALREKLQLFSEAFRSDSLMIELLSKQLSKKKPWSATLKARNDTLLKVLEPKD